MSFRQLVHSQFMTKILGLGYECSLDDIKDDL